MFEEYLKERDLTPESAGSMAECLLKIARQTEKLHNPVFLNLLRGSVIPTVIIQNIINKGSMVINIPASCDEVSNSAVFEILKIYLKKETVNKADIVWVDEAYSGRMAANLGILLTDILKTHGASHFKIHLIADSEGKYIKNEYSTVLGNLADDFRNFADIKTHPVISLHWMDNTGLIGLNWGRRYTMLEKDTIRHLNDHSYSVLRKDTDTADYLMQYHKARAILPGAEITGLENYYYDPHTLWCKSAEEYKQKYLHVESDPSVLIKFDLKRRQDYIEKITAIIKDKAGAK